MKNSPIGLIILTYKDKILLMQKRNSEIDIVKHPWSFIWTVHKRNEPLKENIQKSIQKEMGIKIENIEKISDEFFLAKLTDKDVNNIQRSEHQLLDFFTLEEAKKLILTEETSKLIYAYPKLINL
jgi:hypothetical protein